MRTLWYPTAKFDPYPDGGSMLGGPPRGVLHETITEGVPHYTNAPHITIDRDGKLFQHIPLNRAARALKNVIGGTQTNRQGDVNIQVEMVAYSDKDDWTPAQITSLRNLVEWARVEWGIPDEFPLEQGGGEQYGYGNPLELSVPEWEAFTGWLAHQHVPENDHWDVGSESGVRAVFDGTLDDMLIDLLIALPTSVYVKLQKRTGVPAGSASYWGSDGSASRAEYESAAPLLLGAILSLAVEGVPGPAGPVGPSGINGLRGPVGPQGPEPQGPWVLEIKAAQ